MSSDNTRSVQTLTQPLIHRQDNAQRDPVVAVAGVAAGKVDAGTAHSE